MMTRPPLFMCFSAACVAMKTPRTIMSSTRSHLFQRCLFKCFRNSSAGIVYENVEAVESRDRLLDRGLNGFGIGGVRLNRDRLPAVAFNLFDHRGSRIGAFRVCDSYVRPVGSQAFSDCGTNAARAARDQGNFPSSFLFMVCLLFLLRLDSLCIDWYKTPPWTKLCQMVYLPIGMKSETA